MNMVFIGEYIQKRRKSMGLTQEAVCHGICDCATLSRIENGRVTPRKTVISALLQRLGLPEENYYAFLSKNELEIEALKKEIMGYNIAEKPDECAAALQKLRALTEPDDLLTQQFTLRSQALLSRLKGGTPQEELALLHQAMCLTNPGFALDQIGQFLYTFEEVKLLNQIALCYSDLEQHPQALSIYCQLIEYIQRHYPEVILKNGQLHMILCNYARELNITQQYQQSILIAEKGRTACVQYSHYQFLPDFLALMAECYHFCGQDEKSADHYLQAYYLYRALGDHTCIQLVCKEAKEYLGMEFPYQPHSPRPGIASSVGIG